MPYALRIEGLLAEVESTYGTDPTPTTADNGVRGVGRLWTSLASEFAFPNMREETVSNSLVSVAPGEPAGRFATFTYTVQLMGTAVAYSSSTPVRPECDPLMMACAFARTHTDTSSSEAVDYDLADTGHASATVWIYAGGKLFKLVGCRGNATWSAQAGGLGEITYTMQGMIVDDPTEITTPSITYSTVVPRPSVGMGLVLNAGSDWTPRTEAFEVSTGHTIERLDDVNSADGLEQFAVARTQPTLTFTARADDLANYDPWALRKASTVHTVFATLGTVRLNRVRLDLELAYLSALPENVDVQGFAGVRLTYALRDLQLTFD